MQNRVREIREARGLTLQQVADRVSDMTGERTTRTQISRLELGTRKLTVPWMQRLAAVLECDPTEFLHSAAMAANDGDEVQEPLAGNTTQALAAKTAAALGATAYVVRKSRVPRSGIQDGDLVAVLPNKSPKDGDLVLARMDDHLVIRKFVAPTLLTTNQPGVNHGVQADDATVVVEIVGTIVPIG